MDFYYTLNYLRFRIKLSILIFAIAVLSACATGKNAFEKSKQMDSIPSYQKFLQIYPDSEHAAWVKQRILELTRLADEEERRLIKENKLKIQYQISQIEEFQIGAFKEGQLLAGDWNPTNAVNGYIGVIKFRLETQNADNIVSYYSLGVYDDAIGNHLSPDISSNGVKTAEIIQDVIFFRKRGDMILINPDYDIRGGFVLEKSIHIRNQRVLTKSVSLGRGKVVFIIKGNPVPLDMTRYGDVGIACNLIFINGILDKRDCPFDKNIIATSN